MKAEIWARNPHSSRQPGLLGIAGSLQGQWDLGPARPRASSRGLSEGITPIPLLQVSNSGLLLRNWICSRKTISCHDLVVV